MKTRTLLATMLFVMASVTVKAQPMSYYAMRDNARFLTDRMAYTLGLTERLIDDLYMINYDYIYAVNDYLDDIAYGYHYDDYMAILAARDAAIRLLLTPYQWTRFITYDYFYRPIFFQNARWWFGVYDYYPRTTRFYFGVPRHYANYHGGHFFAGMRPARGHIGPGHGFGPHAGRIGDGFRGNDNYHNGNRGHVGGDNRGYHFENNNRGGNRGGGVVHNDRNNHGGNHNNNGGYIGGNPNNGNNHNNNGGYSGSYNGGNNGSVRGDHNPGGMNRGGSNNGSVRGGSRSNFSSGSGTRVTTPVSEPRTVEVRNNFGSSGRSSMGSSHSAGSVRSVGGGSSNSRPSGFSSAGSSSRASSAGRSMSAGGGSRGGHSGVSRGAGRR